MTLRSRLHTPYMTPYQTRQARPLPPVALLLAGCASFLLAVGALFGLTALAGFLGAAGLFPMLVVGVVGRFLLVASVVLVVLSIVRKLDQR